MAFVQGSAKAKDVASLTILFKDLVTTLFPADLRPNTDDHFFRELLVTVWNRILLRLQDAQVTEKEAEEIGVMLRRVWILGMAYKARKADCTISEWLAKLRGAAEAAGLELPV